MSLESDIKSVVESLGLRLYDITTLSENEETIYRVNITSPKEGGAMMEQIVRVTKLIAPLLDVTSPVRGEYRLEVSSPGIERKLKNITHFECSLGEKVRVQTLDKTKIQGTLRSVDGETIIIESDEGEIRIPFSDISKASTYFEW